MSEDQMQAAYIRYIRSRSQLHPALEWIYHVPNGGKRNYLEAAKFKSMGVRPGISDIIIPFPRVASGDEDGVHPGYCFGNIELKWGGNTLTKDQREYQKYCNQVGAWFATVENNWVTAVNLTSWYLRCPELRIEDWDGG